MASRDVDTTHLSPPDTEPEMNTLVKRQKGGEKGTSFRAWCDGTICQLGLERVPIGLNRKRALDSLIGRIFCGKPPKSAVADLGDIECRSRVNPRSVSIFPENALETTDPGLGLRAPEIIGRRFRLFRRLEHGAEPTRHLRKAQNGFRCNIALIGQDLRDAVHRAGTLLQGMPRVAVRLHAREDVVGPRRSRIIVELGRA